MTLLIIIMTDSYFETARTPTIHHDFWIGKKWILLATANCCPLLYDMEFLGHQAEVVFSLFSSLASLARSTVWLLMPEPWHIHPNPPPRDCSADVFWIDLDPTSNE